MVRLAGVRGLVTLLTLASALAAGACGGAGMVGEAVTVYGIEYRVTSATRSGNSVRVAIMAKNVSEDAQRIGGDGDASFDFVLDAKGTIYFTAGAPYRAELQPDETRDFELTATVAGSAANLELHMSNRRLDSNILGSIAIDL